MKRKSLHIASTSFVYVAVLPNKYVKTKEVLSREIFDNTLRHLYIINERRGGVRESAVAKKKRERKRWSSKARAKKEINKASRESCARARPYQKNLMQ